DKNSVVLEAGLRSLELARAAGVKIGFGSDLLRRIHDDRCREFVIRAEVMSPQEIIRAATLINAEIIRQSGKLGEIVPGAFADVLIVEGDPFRDLNLFQDDGAHLAAIVKGGHFVKQTL